MHGKVLADAIVQKFEAAVPVFFGLCRRLRLARLDLVHRLAGSLVFSVLYGCEFLSRFDVIEKCEAAWWSGMRQFYGLPNGVSAIFLKHLFPRVSICEHVVRAKFCLLFRGTKPLETLFPEAVVCDRGLLFARHRVGFSQILKEWYQFTAMPAAFDTRDMSEVCDTLATSRAARHDAEWETFATMPSTGFAASLFASPSALYSTMLELSRFGALGVRVGALAIAGALLVPYSKSRFCFCGQKFSFAHFLDCGVLGPCRSQSLCLAVDCGDWREAASIILSRFELYIHLERGGELRAEERELFELLNAVTVGSDEEADA
jgi:hypothetical protein